MFDWSTGRLYVGRFIFVPPQDMPALDADELFSETLRRQRDQFPLAASKRRTDNAVVALGAYGNDGISTNAMEGIVLTYK